MSVDMLGEIMNRALERPGSRGMAPVINGEITLDHVKFHYPDAAAYAIRDLSLEIPAGSTLGVVGRSGSGKTTLSALLQGLYTASDGAIRYDGFDLRDMDLHHLRAQIGVVPQEPFLFQGTIADNIRMGSPGATQEALVEAAKLAGADEFIKLLPRRYDTVLEESAVNLSGGQRQRLCIARALLRNPKIIILDEATSALDPESEAVVVANLAKMASNRTTIIISHRLQTICRADKILILDDGQMLDLGTHSQLMQRSTLYRTLWSQQMGEPK